MENEILTPVAWTLGGTGIASLVFVMLRFILVRISKDATTFVGDSAQRGQITDFRDEIKRLEVIIREQTVSINRMNMEVMKLRFAFIDEQAALLRLLNEMSHIDDPQVKSRISSEIHAANQRRSAIMGAANESSKANEACVAAGAA